MECKEALELLIKDYDRYIKSAEDYLKYLKEQREAFVLTLKEVKSKEWQK